MKSVVGENSSLGDVRPRAYDEGLRVDYSLAEEAAAVKKIHVYLAADGAVGLAAPGT